VNGEIMTEVCTPSWKVAKPEIKTSFIPSRDKVTGKETSIPVTRAYIRLKHKSGDEWVITMNPNGKFSVRFPDSEIPVERRKFKTYYGYYESGEKIVIPQKETSMDVETLKKFLIGKFGQRFTLCVFHMIKKVIAAV
jgi:hypothetical protein